MPPRTSEDTVEDSDDGRYASIDDIYAPEEEDGAETDQTVADMIQETIAAVPSAVLKFRIINPGIVAKTAKKNEARRKATAKREAKKQGTSTAAQTRQKGQNSKKDDTSEPLEKEANDDIEPTAQDSVKSNKRKAHAENDDNEGAHEASDAEVIEKTKEKKKKKVSAPSACPDEDGTEDEEPKEAIPLSAYIYVEKPVAPRATKGKLSDAEKYITKGPVSFKSTDSYIYFLYEIARALPCPLSNILEDKMMWRYQTPQTSMPLPLGKSAGFSTMVDGLKAKRAGTRVAIIIMPPPKKPDELPPWETNNDEKPPEQVFDYGELEKNSTGDSIVQQRVRFNTAVGPTIKLLKDKYPINNNPLFPGKRVYTDVNSGWNWELTEVRLNVWASHIARTPAAATLEQPPQSNHFDANARILPKNLAADVVPAAVAPAAISATPAPASALVLAPAAAPATDSTSKLMELMMLNMLQQQQAAMSTRLQNPADLIVPPAAAPPLPAPVATAHALDIPNISLEAFCSRYHLDPKDKERLERLEFRPGDNIDELGPEEWKDFGGFLLLSWSRVKSKNVQFLRDVQSGLWDSFNEV